MSNLPEVPKDTSIKTLLAEIMPAMTQDVLKEKNSKAELDGTEISMVVEVGSSIYSYLLLNGEEVKTAESDVDGAMLRMKISEDDLKKMIETGNLDMILGVQQDLTRAKYNAISSLRGSFIAEVTNDDGSVVSIEAILNGALEPKSIFKMSAADTTALMNKETNPVNLFMSGAMKIEGDMGFAMSTQPLFS